MPATSDDQALICFSHLRWNFVFQRPQHLMSRFARERRVIYWEEPEAALPECEPALGVRTCAETGVHVVTPSLPEGMSRGASATPTLKALLDDFLAGEKRPLDPLVLHADDAALLAAHRRRLHRLRLHGRARQFPLRAAASCSTLERELLATADVVFTGGYSLYEAKKDRHPNVHPFPSSVDRAHFAQARADRREPGRPGRDRRARASASTAWSTSGWTSI